MSVPARVGLATLGVADVARSTEFYASLGWRLSSASVRNLVSYFHTAGGLLSLVATGDITAAAGLAPRTGADFRGTMLTVTVESPAAVDAALRTAVQAGGTLVRRGGEAGWGGYLGYFTDPDGHLWQVAYHPDWPLTDDGVPRLP